MINSGKLKILIIFTAFFLISFCSKKTDSNTKNDTKNLSQSKLINSRIILQINDKSFTNENFKNYLAGKYRDILTGNNLDKSGLLSRLFDSFIDQSVLLYYADKDGVEVSTKEYSDYMKNHDLHESKYKKEMIIRNLKIEKYLFDKIYKNIIISSGEIKNYYRKQSKEFRRKSELELYQIFVTSKEKAVKIRGELLNFPKNFEKIAAENSQPGMPGKSGFIGKFEKGDLPKEMEDVVFSLKLNQISRILETKFGFHIFKVTKRRGARKQYLKNVEHLIREKLKSEKIETTLKNLISELKNSASVTIKKKNLFFNYVESQGEINEKINSHIFNSNNTIDLICYQK